jgi:hypothetical protein
MGGTSGALSEYGGAASTVSESVGLASASSGQRAAHAKFRVQANIWLELAQLFLEAGRIGDVQRCVDEACQAFPNSHQALYLKVMRLSCPRQRFAAGSFIARTSRIDGRRGDAQQVFVGGKGVFSGRAGYLSQSHSIAAPSRRGLPDGEESENG